MWRGHFFPPYINFTFSVTLSKELESAIEKMNTYSAWEIDAEAKRMLEAVGIPESMLGTHVSKVHRKGRWRKWSTNGDREA